MDPVRLRSILRRESPEDVRAWLFDHGLHALREPTVLPPVEALGMRERVCCPVRHADVLLGYLWVLGTGDGVLPALAAVAGEAGTILYRRRLEETTTRAEEVAALERAVLEEGAGPVVVVRIDKADAAVPLQSALEQALRRATGGAAGRCLGGEGELILAGADVPSLGEALERVAPTEPSGLGEDLAAARRAALLAELLDKDGPLSLDDVPLEAYLLSVARDDPSAISVPPPACALLAADAGLAETIEVYLDLGGDIAATTDALSVSRAGLYRRLHRAQEVADFDLGDGAQRMLVHLGLKAARLAR